MRLLTRSLLACALAAGAVLSAELPDPKQPESVVTLPAAIVLAKDPAAAMAKLPEAMVADARTKWDAFRAKADAEFDAKFTEAMTMLTAEGAIDQLMAMATPALASYNPAEAAATIQMVGGMMAMGMAQKPDATAEDRAAAATLQRLMIAVGAWLPNADFGNPEKLKTALGHLITGAKAMRVADAAALRALSYQELMARVGAALPSLKAALATYDLQIDAFCRSVKATSAGTGATRTVTATFTAFGQEFSMPMTVKQNAAGFWEPEKPMANPLAGPGAPPTP